MENNCGANRSCGAERTGRRRFGSRPSSGVPPVEQTMPHKRARYALRGILPAYGIQSAMHRSLAIFEKNKQRYFASMARSAELRTRLDGERYCAFA
jgi:hypothetical protein